MAYQGYDPFNDIGTQVSTALTGHTILLAAYNLDANRFELLVSNIFGDGATAFSSLRVCTGEATARQTLATMNVEDSTHNNVGSVSLNSVIYEGCESYYWDIDNPLTGVADDEQFSVILDGFTAEQTGEEFDGLVQWPHLDLGSIGQEKQLIGLDLVADAAEGVSVSVGYNQRDLAARTTPYAIDADTLPGQLIPMPVSGPSFDLQLTFEPNQQWEWQAANLYVQDWRLTS